MFPSTIEPISPLRGVTRKALLVEIGCEVLATTTRGPWGEVRRPGLRRRQIYFVGFAGSVLAEPWTCTPVDWLT